MNGPTEIILVPLLYSDFFGYRPTRHELETHLAELDWRHVVMFAVGIECISFFRKGVEDNSQQQQLTEAMTSTLPYGPRVIELMAREPHRRLFTREGLFGLVRVVVEGQHVREGGNAQAPDILVRGLLMANEITSEELLPTEITNSATDLTRGEVRSTVLRFQNPHDLLARTDALMRWSQTDKARRSPNYLCLSEDLTRFTGLTWSEYAACAYAVISRYTGLRTWAEVERNGVSFDAQVWLRTLKDKRAIERWLTFNTISMRTLASEWTREKSISLASAGPLWRRPFVKSADNLVFAPSIAMLANAMGDGVYFALFDSYGDETGDSTKKLRLSRFYGEFFQDYVSQRFGSGFSSREDAIVYEELEYVGGLSTDLVIFEGDDVLFIEVVAKRMKLTESILQLDEAAIIDDIEHAVVKKVRELHKHIEHYRAGSLFPDMPRPAGQRIFPVLVSPSDLPPIRIISDVLAKLETKEGLPSAVEPVELLDTTEVEDLEGDIAAGLRLSDLFYRKNRSTPQNRMMTLNNYLIYIEPEAAARTPSPSRVRGNEVAKAMVELALSWF